MEQISEVLTGSLNSALVTCCWNFFIKYSSCYWSTYWVNSFASNFSKRYYTL